MAAKADERKQKIIGAVRDALALDGRVRNGVTGRMLERDGLAHEASDWYENGFKLLLREDGTLAKSVFEFCRQNGMEAEATAFNDNARSAYWNKSKAWWISNVQRLRKELAAYEKQIAAYAPADFVFPSEE